VLILSRKPGQSIVIGGIIEITIAEVRGDQVRLGITAPRKVPVFRKEVLEGYKGEPPTPPDEKEMLEILSGPAEAPLRAPDAPVMMDNK
jgi:carbon storage regulator